MSWTVDRITAKCAEFSAMVGDTYDCPIALNGRLSRTLGRVILGTERGRVIPIKMEFSKEFLNTSTDASIIGHEWAHYYVTKTTGINHKHDQEFKKACALYERQDQDRSGKNCGARIFIQVYSALPRLQLYYWNVPNFKKH